MTARLAIGSQLAGHRVDELVARGGMGIIYRATHLRLLRPVALKLVSPDLSHDQSFRERFRRESELAASIDHPNVIPIYEAGEQDGTLYLAMRWVEGVDLGALISSEGPLEPARAARIIFQVASALDAAHARELIHRDVKPANVLLAEGEHVYLTDFGLTRHAASRALTGSGEWLGTVDYVAPEQVEGRPLSALTDVYSLGCVLHEILTGRVPYPRAREQETLFAHVNLPAPSVTEGSPGVPAEFDGIVGRAMAKDPSERYPTAGELGRAALAAAGELEAALAAAKAAAVVRPAAATTSDREFAHGSRETVVSAEAAARKPARHGPFPVGLEAAALTDVFGRTEEWGEMLSALNGIRTGGRRGVFLAGEPGIGKTALAATLAREAHSSGARVLYGRCDEELGVPYRPFVDALGQYVRAAPDELLDRILVDHGSVLTRIVPQLARRATSVSGADVPTTEGDLYSLFVAVGDLLAAASVQEPIVMVVDDLHWADRPTILLLRYLLTSPTEMAVLVIGTYRSSELAEGHPLPDLIGDLHPQNDFTLRTLEGLRDEDITRMTAAAAGHELDQEGLELSRALHHETDGNPFYAMEILRNLAESGELVRSDGRWSARDMSELALPGTVRETINRRVTRFAEHVRERLGTVPARHAREILGTAAVLGREIDVELLVRVTRLDRDELLEVLDAAHRAALLMRTPGAGGSFSFSHALIEHALYEELGAAERRRAHRRIAEALEQMHGDDPGPRIGELARHWLEAMQPGEAAKALDYLRRAGESALVKLSPDDAARWYEAALDLHRKHPEGGDEARCELLIGLGAAECQSGSPAFRETLLDAAHLAQRIGDHDRLVRAALANTRGFVSETGEVDTARVAVLEAALEVAKGRDSIEHALLLSTLAAELTFAGDWQRRKELSDRSLAMARRLSDPRTLSEVLSARFMTIWTPETLAERCANAADDLAGVERGDGDLLARFRALHWRATACVESGELHEAERRIEEESRVADRLGQPTPRWMATYDRAIQALIRGDLQEAEQRAEEAGRIGNASGQPEAGAFLLGQLVNIRFEQGRLIELEPLIARLLPENPGIPAFRAALTLARAEGGMYDEAREVMEVDAETGFAEFAYDSNWLVGLAIYAEACGLLGDAEPAAALSSLLEPWIGQIAFNSATAWGAVSRHVGLLNAVLGRWDEGERQLVQAARVHEQAGAPIWLARTRLDLARLLLARGAGADRDRDRARRLLEQALASARDHGCAGIERRVSELLTGPGIAGASGTVAQKVAP